MKHCGRGCLLFIRDYEKTKANVLSLKSYIDAYAGEKVLTHIDAVPDNFLFVEKDGKKEIRLIDWEYAGMQRSSCGCGNVLYLFSL